MYNWKENLHLLNY